MSSLFLIAVQRFIKKPKAQEIVASKTVTFDCIVEGIPKPRILWKFKPHNSDNFARIDSLDQRRFKLSPNGTLTIKNVHFSDKGLYVCVAKSPGKETDATAFLMVYGEFIVLYGIKVYFKLDHVRFVLKNYYSYKAL